jgi:hypothetical protein
MAKRIQRGISQRTAAERDGLRDYCRGPQIGAVALNLSPVAELRILTPLG